jgi:formylglycine-generating enzyme required for sulfatase activity
VNEDVHRAMTEGAPALTLDVGAAGIELLRIPEGEFTMGSPEDEPGRAPNEGPPRHVRISRAFYIGRFQLTRGQFRTVMHRVPEGNDDSLPVSQVTYADALEFCGRLSEATLVDVRLPTEAQWEYACRAGARTPYFSGTTEADLARVGWYTGNADGRAHPVGRRPPNAWGLHDVHGNVWEFCADLIESYAEMAGTDPVGRVSPTHGAMRGGGWMHGPEECRSASRMVSDDMFGGAGLRIEVDAP